MRVRSSVMRWPLFRSYTSDALEHASAVITGMRGPGNATYDRMFMIEAEGRGSDSQECSQGAFHGDLIGLDWLLVGISASPVIAKYF